MIKIWGASDDLVDIATSHVVEGTDTRFSGRDDPEVKGWRGWELSCYEKSTEIHIVEGPPDAPDRGCIVHMRYFGAVAQKGCWSAEVSQLDEGTPMPPVSITHADRGAVGRTGYSVLVSVESEGQVSWTQHPDKAED